MKISVVIPCFQAELTIHELCDRLEVVLTQITTESEIILVDDGSIDATWESISQISKMNRSVLGIKLSRNFGQHNAITAGLAKSTGEWIVVMDCDLQDQPEEISKLYKKSQEGYEVVVGIRNARRDKLSKRISSVTFYWFFQRMAGIQFDKRIGNFGIYSKKVIKSILELKEQHRSFALMVLWAGFKRANVDIKHAERESGKSSYSFTHRTALALDSVVSHSNKLLYVSIRTGLMISIISVLLAGLFVFRYLFFGITTQGWTSLIISIYLTSGILLSGMGILGIYLGKVFNETKARPIYIVEALTNEK